MNIRMLPGVLLCLVSAGFSHAQTVVDSVVVSGQVQHLSARLYRQSPTVSVSRTNILRGGADQPFVSPLQTNGQFRVAVPIIYPLEEMTFQVGNASTAFLATAGSVTITIDNDSLYVAAVPFRFGGVNAQVNQQFAQYKAVEAGQLAGKEAARKKTIRRALSGSSSDIFFALNTLFTSPLASFSATQSIFPLVSSWVQANARYDAAAYVFDKASEAAQPINGVLLTTMLTGAPNLMTPARAIALSRFGMYATSIINRNESLNTRGIKIRTITNLLLRYGQGLTASDRERLTLFAQNNSARQNDLRYLSQLMEHNPDTLGTLIRYENLMNTARLLVDSASLDYLKGYSLAVTVPSLKIDLVSLLGQHIRSQLTDRRLQQSLDDLLALALRDTALVRQARTAYLALDRKGGTGIVGDGLTVNTGSFKNGNDLVQKAIDRNRNRVIYVILWQPDDEQRLQLAQDAQRLRDVFSTNELTLLYVYPNSTDDKLWLESVVRNRLRGEHVRLTERQTLEATPLLNLFDSNPVRLFTPKSKLDRKETLLPDQFDKLVAQIRELLP